MSEALGEAHPRVRSAWQSPSLSVHPNRHSDAQYAAATRPTSLCHAGLGLVGGWLGRARKSAESAVSRFGSVEVAWLRKSLRSLVCVNRLVNASAFTAPACPCSLLHSRARPVSLNRYDTCNVRQPDAMDRTAPRGSGEGTWLCACVLAWLVHRTAARLHPPCLRMPHVTNHSKCRALGKSSRRPGVTTSGAPLYRSDIILGSICRLRKP